MSILFLFKMPAIPQPLYLSLLIVIWLSLLAVAYSIYFRKEIYSWCSRKKKNGDAQAEIVNNNHDPVQQVDSVTVSQYSIDRSFTDFDDILSQIAAHGKKWYIKLFICCGGGFM